MVASASAEPEPCALPPEPDVVPDDSVPIPTSTPTFACAVPLAPVPPTFTVPSVAELTLPSTLSAATGRAKPRERRKPRVPPCEPRSLKPAECRFTAPRQGLTLPWSMSNVFHFLCSLFDIDGIHAGKTRGAKLALEKARRGNHPFV